MQVAMLGESLYQYDFEPVGNSYDPTEDPLGVSQDAGTRYSNFQYMGAIQNGFSLNIPSIAEFEESVAARSAGGSTKAERQVEAKKDVKFKRVLQGIDAVTGTLTSAAKEILPFLTDKQKSMVQDEIVQQRIWWSRNQAWVIIGGTVAVAVLVIGLTVSRRRKRR